MDLSSLLIFITLTALQPDTNTASSLKVEWSDAMAVVSFLFNFFLGIMLWLLNRKHGTEQELRKKNNEQLDLASSNIRDHGLALQSAVIQVDNLRRELSLLQTAVGNLADDADLSEMRGDFRTVKRDLEEARISLAGHQNACAHRFVHRESYSEDQKVQRESIGLIHEIINQQRDIIEKLRH